jgi:hypothetical protein
MRGFATDGVRIPVSATALVELSCENACKQHKANSSKTILLLILCKNILPRETIRNNSRTRCEF